VKPLGGSRRRGRRGSARPATLGPAAAALSAAALAGCGGGHRSASVTTYSAQVQKSFVSSCVDSATDTASGSTIGSDEAERICGCMYDELEANMPFEGFEAADEALRNG
jgi:hypothetical protein